MEWEIVLRPRHPEANHEGRRLTREWVQQGVSLREAVTAGKVYLLSGPMSASDVERFTRELLVDAVLEVAEVWTGGNASASGRPMGALNRELPLVVTVLPKPGVMDPAAESVEYVLASSGWPGVRVRTGRRYWFPGNLSVEQVTGLAWRWLANAAVEAVYVGPLPASAWAETGSAYVFKLVSVPLAELDDNDLLRLSRQGQLALSLAEMRTIQAHFRHLGRAPTDVELETIAQTWSEHCSHKTLKGRIEFHGLSGTKRYQNLLKETIFAATEQIRRRLGADDWCVSVFTDNAGVVRFDDQFHVCFKVETHNHPSAIEPYGGASTGLGGVIRDVLGTGLGGKPIANIDVFCFAPPTAEPLPPGVLPPERVLRGVVAGVRDYGNRMGIPTVNGAVCFDRRYLANPLVYCGTIGLLPAGLESKQPRAGDWIVAVGGRTGRDGIHGATFSSIELTSESEQISGGAVQIGNAITQKKMLDVLLQARDQGLYTAITDCGAGGFSSAIGEMGADLGAEVELSAAPLKYAGLSYTEIWISESQERMVLAVPPDKKETLLALCRAEDVEVTVLGRFTNSGRLRLTYADQVVADLDLHFLHHGRPEVERQAHWQPPPLTHLPPPPQPDYSRTVLGLLAAPNIRSKEWIIRQYDHEVQGATAVKPLVGPRQEGPGDAAVVTPILGQTRGLAVGCGINPALGDIDPYWMAAWVVDEAIRNVVAVGADPRRIALLDNFCWGNTDRPEVLGSLVLAAEGCHAAALAFGTPFISGKDSLKNEFHGDQVHLVIPPTLLISAIGLVPEVQQCVTTDLKQAGNLLLLLGTLKNQLGGSQFYQLAGGVGGEIPRVDFELGPRVVEKLHAAIRAGCLAACHDVSEGGLVVAVAEMCLGGDLGAELQLPSPSADLPLEAWLFAESPTCFVLEVPPAMLDELRRRLADLPLTVLGQVMAQPCFRIFAGSENKCIVDLRLEDLREAFSVGLAPTAFPR
jgi:phosphoribosylformylglycinamidine synthase